ncbi:MAG: CRISPR-associated endonuclease Cas2 [Candidatus Sericytochromatia bacterium]
MEENYILLIYDVQDSKIRTQIYETAKDYGLDSIQFSVFLGKLNRNMREELFYKVSEKVKNQEANILLVPIGEKEFKKIKSTGSPLAISQKSFMSFV